MGLKAGNDGDFAKHNKSVKKLEAFGAKSVQGRIIKLYFAQLKDSFELYNVDGGRELR
jgi:hypothetical protein